MKNALKKRLAVGVLVLGFVGPFVLLQDFFPFYRFGMFAEPVRGAVQSERFWVSYQVRGGKMQIFSPEKLGIAPESYRLWLRNYHYRGEGQVLLQQLARAGRRTHEEATVWRLHRLAHPTDTSTVAEFESGE